MLKLSIKRGNKMQKILDVNAIKLLVKKYSLETIIKKTMDRIEYDFSRWEEFDIIPRPAFHVPGGVIELMPSADKEYFSYKCVNGHPINPSQNKLTVVATGQLNNTYDGYPILITEMTILTAIRTAATAALAAKYLSKTNSSKLAIIGKLKKEIRRRLSFLKWLLKKYVELKVSLEDWSDYFVHSSACNDSALQIADTVYSRVRELIYNKRQFNLTNQKIKLLT